MNRALNIISLFLFILLFNSSAFSQEKQNFFDFRCADYSNGFNFPMPATPIIKIYQDGTAIFRKRNGKYFSDSQFFEANIDLIKLTRLKNRLRRESILQKSLYIDLKKGGGIGLHGGICSIRFLDGNEAVLLATSIYPTNGSLRKIIKAVEKFLPPKAMHFYPKEIKIDVDLITDTCEFVSSIDDEKVVIDNWQFTNKLSLTQTSLADKSLSIELKDLGIIRFLFQEMYKGKSLMFSWLFCENKKRYSIDLKEIPGWYNAVLGSEQDFEAQRLKNNWEKENIKRN